MNALILDDEQHCIDTLEFLIKKYCLKITNTVIFLDPIDALGYLQNNKVDVIFLDIDMPEMSGFDFLAALGDTNASVIFTTAHSEYAVKAFKFNAVGYLLKPIIKLELIEAINKIIDKPLAMSKELIDQIIHNTILFQNPKTNRISIPCSEGYLMMNSEDIIYCESEGSYTYIITTDNKKILTSKNLKELEELIENSKFYRLHKSYLINLDKIKKVIKSDGGEVMMQDGKSLPISRTIKQDFFSLFK